MTLLERIKKLCREKKNISITTLEQELGYSNGSLSKAKDLPCSRVFEISRYLGVSMDFLVTGDEYNAVIEMADVDTELLAMNNIIKEYALKLSRLSSEDKEHITKIIDKFSED